MSQTPSTDDWGGRNPYDLFPREWRGEDEDDE